MAEIETVIDILILHSLKDVGHECVSILKYQIYLSNILARNQKKRMELFSIWKKYDTNFGIWQSGKI